MLDTPLERAVDTVLKLIDVAFKLTCYVIATILLYQPVAFIATLTGKLVGGAIAIVLAIAILITLLVALVIRVTKGTKARA